MLRYTVRRILIVIPLLFILAFFTYTLTFYGPGDPLVIMMGENWTSEDVYQSLREEYGMNRPMLVIRGSRFSFCVLFHSSRAAGFDAR